MRNYFCFGKLTIAHHGLHHGSLWDRPWPIPYFIFTRKERYLAKETEITEVAGLNRQKDFPEFSTRFCNALGGYLNISVWCRHSKLHCNSENNLQVFD